MNGNKSCARCAGEEGAHQAWCMLADMAARIDILTRELATAQLVNLNLIRAQRVTDDELYKVYGPVGQEEERETDEEWWARVAAEDDPPDPTGVAGDVMTAHGFDQGDGDWGAPELAERYAEATDPDNQPEGTYEWVTPDDELTYVTHLPDGYYDGRAEEGETIALPTTVAEPPKRASSGLIVRPGENTLTPAEVDYMKAVLAEAKLNQSQFATAIGMQGNHLSGLVTGSRPSKVGHRKVMEELAKLERNEWADDEPTYVPRKTREEREQIAAHIEAAADDRETGAKEAMAAAGREFQAEQRKAREESVIEYLTDSTESVSGGRVRLDQLHKEFDTWCGTHRKVGMAKPEFRRIVEGLGYTCQQGRMPGERASGKPPVLVHGLVRKVIEAPVTPRKPAAEVVVFKDPSPARSHHPLLGDKPGSELTAEMRKLIEPLITEQGWCYHKPGGGRARPSMTTPKGVRYTLPSAKVTSKRYIANVRTQLRKQGAVL